MTMFIDQTVPPVKPISGAKPTLYDCRHASVIDGRIDSRNALGCWTLPSPKQQNVCPEFPHHRKRRH